MEDVFTIANKNFNSRLIVGTGKYKSFEETYKDGEGDELWTYWYENGQKSFEKTYKYGKIDGLTIGWYQNGQKSIEGAYKNNERNGEWTFYKEDGTVYEVKEY